MDKTEIDEGKKVIKELKGLKDFSNVYCELHSIDFEMKTVTFSVPKRVLEHGLNAGNVHIDFTNLTKERH